MNNQNWEIEFDEKYTFKYIRPKGKLGFYDDVKPDIIKSFIQSLLDAERAWWQQHEKDMYEEVEKSHREELDTERAELVKEVIEIVGFVDEDFLTTPDCEEYPAEWAINKDRQRIIKALDTVIEKIKNK